MSAKVLIPAVILSLIAVGLLLFGLSESSLKTYDVTSLLSSEIAEDVEIEGLFQGYLYAYDEKTEDTRISDENPYTVKDAQVIEVVIDKNTQKPQLYLGAQIFVYGVFSPKNRKIYARKIEASCPSKEMDKLESGQDN